MKNNRLNIEVYGAYYPIVTPEPSEYVYELGDEIDTSVKSIVEASSASLTEALVLTALSYLDAYKKAESGSDNLRQQIAEYIEEASSAKRELAAARAEIERLNRDHQLKFDNN